MKKQQLFCNCLLNFVRNYISFPRPSIVKNERTTQKLTAKTAEGTLKKYNLRLLTYKLNMAKFYIRIGSFLEEKFKNKNQMHLFGIKLTSHSSITLSVEKNGILYSPNLRKIYPLSSYT